MREKLLRLAGGFLRLGFLAEKRCPNCGQARQDPAGRRASLCPDCLAESASPQGAPCPGCGAWPPVAQTSALLCGDCRRAPRPWGRLVAFGPYGGRLRDAILAYKFESRLDLGRQLQEYALSAFERGAAVCPELAACEVIVPVPLHSRRLAWRGFNQSRELARLLSARRGVPIVQEALSRVRRTVPQMKLGREARVENIRGAFMARRDLVDGRSILLVDDIMTTGATLEECARTMLTAGAARVDVLVLARA